MAWWEIMHPTPLGINDDDDDEEDMVTLSKGYSYEDPQ